MAAWPRLCLLVVCFAYAYPESTIDYSGYKVLELSSPLTKKQHHYLLSLEDEGFDFWSSPHARHRPAQLLLSPREYGPVTKRLKNLGIGFTSVVADVQRLIDKEFDYPGRRKRDAESNGDRPSRVPDRFSSHAEITEWVEKAYEYCHEQHTLNCNLYTIGKTYEGRSLKVLHVGRRFYRYPRLSVWIDGGTHAREWISPTVAVNIIDKLVYGENTKTNSSGCDRCLPHLLDMYDFYILPVVNPDGYEYTKRNRLWRKNRRPNGISKLSASPWWHSFITGRSGGPVRCYGVDLNRNFGYHWGESGTSTKPCSDVYGGKMAFSERESQAVRRFISSRLFNKWSNRLYMFITLHSYGQYILYPWGHTTITPEDVGRLHYVATEGDRVQRNCYGTSYRVGSAAKTLYTASGGSDDWAKGSIGIPFAYTIELPPGEDHAAGTNGFIVPEKHIPAVVGRFWPGLQAMLNAALAFARDASRVYNRFPRPKDCPGQYRCSCSCQSYRDKLMPTPWCKVNDHRCSQCH